MSDHRVRISLSLVTCVLSLGYSSATAQEYPSRPVRWIVPFSPGGPSDIIGRFFAQKLSDGLGKPVVVDNRSGATGIIAFEIRPALRRILEARQLQSQPDAGSRQ